MSAPARRTPSRTAAKAAATAPGVDAEVARRVARCLGRAAVALRWKAGEVAEWEGKAQAALEDTGARSAGLARQIERLARQLERPGDAREARRAAALLAVRAARARATTENGVLDALLGALRKAVAFEQATAFVCTAGDGRLSPLVVEGAHVDLIPDIAFDHGAGFSSWVAKSRRPVLLSTDREEFDAAGEGRPGSVLSVPLLAEDELVGVLNLAHSRPGAFTGADRDFVVLAGRLAAAALRRLRQAPAAPAAGATSAVAESALARAGA